jgi:hypothetical protein
VRHSYKPAVPPGLPHAVAGALQLTAAPPPPPPVLTLQDVPM